jgi:hypothetical protein
MELAFVLESAEELGSLNNPPRLAKVLGVLEGVSNPEFKLPSQPRSGQTDLYRPTLIVLGGCAAGRESGARPAPP